ncbi:RibD family protein [Salininema proteolyticum]|uniref:RibD family protein n=1 Tax=Salininema proteolyticum TaxID=1607685 RepID=A0ABV8U2L8_9ACTN
MKKPHVILSAAMSLDGYLDDTTPNRLMLSDAADFDRVDRLRATADAILVGAGTVRADNPRLLVRSPERVQMRQASGKSAQPAKVVLTHGDLDPDAAFFTEGDSEKIVYTDAESAEGVREMLGEVSEVREAEDLATLLNDLEETGVARLLVEGGSGVHTSFLTSGFVDELHLAVAPFFVGDSLAPRFVGDGRFAFDKDNRLELIETRQVGTVALLKLQAPGDDGA